MADSERKKKFLKHVEETSDDWEPEGKFGNDPEFMKLGKTKAKKSDLRSIRIDEEFLNELREAATDEGFDSYQAFIKVVLKKYLRSKKQKKA